MTVSQNVWDWKGTSRHHLARNSGLKRYHLQPRTMSLWILSKDGESNLCKCSVSLTVKEVFPDVQREPPVLLCANCLWSHHWAVVGEFRLGLLCTAPPGIYKNWTISTTGYKVPTLSLLSLKRCSRSVTIFVTLCWVLSTGPIPGFPHFSSTGEARSGNCTPSVASPVLSRREVWAPSSRWQYFAQYSPGTNSLSQECTAGLFHHGAYQGLHVLSPKLFSSCLWQFLTSCRILHFPMLNFMTLLCAVQPFGIPATPPALCLLHNCWGYILLPYPGP